MSDRTELRALLEDATPGPWEAEGSQVWGPDGVLVAAVRDHSTMAVRPDARLIAAANPAAIRDLLDELDTLEVALRLAHAYREALEESLEAAEATLRRVREASAQHPECDRHGAGGPVTCGWKRAVEDIRCALDGQSGGESDD